MTGPQKIVILARMKIAGATLIALFLIVSALAEDAKTVERAANDAGCHERGNIDRLCCIDALGIDRALQIGRYFVGGFTDQQRHSRPFMQQIA